MTIRYKCDSCGSKLNIKEELAGTQGKCPKCKTAFVVPQPIPAGAEATADVSQATNAADATGATQPASGPKGRLSAKEKLTAKSKPTSSAGDDDFDPVAFLMDDEPSAGSSRSALALSDDEIPMELELELDEDEPPVSKRSRRRVELDSDAEMQLGSASESAGAMLSGGGSSASAAKDLLTRTVEESRARSGRLDDDEPTEPSAARELAVELTKRGLPALVAIVLVAWYLGSSLLTYMSGAEYPDLGRVTGVVTLNGQPLPGARVTFRPKEKEFPINESRMIKVRSSKAYTDEEGYYDLKYDEDVHGAVVGQHVVKISKLVQGQELVPLRYSGFPQEQRTVEEGSQEIDFAITAKASPAPDQ